MPPADLNIGIMDSGMLIVVTLSWQYQDKNNDNDEIVYYQLSAINATTSEIISTIYTNQTYYTHTNIGLFFNNSDDCNLSSIMFYVRSIRVQPMTCLSVKSEAVRFPNSSSITRFCQGNFLECVTVGHAGFIYWHGNACDAFWAGKLQTLIVYYS